MDYSRPSHFNGAYDAAVKGVSPPPQHPPQTYHRPGGHHRSCGPRCLLCTLLKLIFAAVIIVGIFILVVWLVYRPSTMKFYVENASLTQFNLTNSNILHYNLTLDVSIRNPNTKIGFYYEGLEAAAYYGGERFGWVALPALYQGHKNTTMIYPAFSGQSVMVLTDSITRDFHERTLGWYNIDVNIRSKVRFVIGNHKSKRYITPEVWCRLIVRLGSYNAGVARTECRVHF